MRSDTGSQPARLPGDSHTPTPKGGGSGREPVTDSRGTPTGVWESQSLWMDEQTERLVKAVAETVRRRELRKSIREDFRHRRALGLPLRQAAKLRDKP